jgi:hypothetical protein
MSYLSLTILSFFLISCSINTAKFNYRTIVINIPCLEWNLEFDRKDFIEISNSKINIDYCWAGFRAYDKNTNINISVHIIKPDSDYFYYTNFIEYIEFELSNERTGLHYNYQEALKNNIIKTRHYKDFFIAEYILESYRYVYVYQMHYKIWRYDEYPTI